MQVPEVRAKLVIQGLYPARDMRGRFCCSSPQRV
jgi:hypothetical protein